MIETPIQAAVAASCTPAGDSLGSLFTQCAVQVGRRAFSLNVIDVRAGDVILVAHPAPVPITNPVYRYQRVLFDPGTACWTHCAVIDENLTVWDAMPSADVRSRPLRALLCEPHRLKLVRPTVPLDLVALRTSLLQFSNHRFQVFNVSTAGRLAARLLRTGKLADLSTDDRSVICSLFVANVLRRATKHGFFRTLPIAVPADFVGDPDFTDVPLRWTEVAP